MGKFWRRLEVGWGKVAWWSTKVAISPKRVQIGLDEKLLWRAYRNSPTLFRTVPFPTPYSLPFPKIRVRNPNPKTVIAIISGKGKATDCKFGRYIARVHLNNSTLKIMEKRERGSIQGLPTFLSTPYYLSSG